MELRKAWCRETAHPSYQKKWSEYNPSFGQCLVTALCVQDKIGGDIYECFVNGKRHFINRTQDGCNKDFTQEQFCQNKIIYKNLKQRTRTSLMRGSNVRNRYNLLKSRLEDKLNASIKNT